MSGQREQPTSATDVEERTARQVADPQRLSQRPARTLDARLVYQPDKGLPVRSEGEAAAGRDLNPAVTHLPISVPPVPADELTRFGSVLFRVN